MRPFRESDLDAVRALFEIERARHHYAARPIELLEAAAAAGGDEGEYRVLVADDGGSVRGAVVYGMVAGAVGTGMLHGVVVAREWRRRGTGRALADAACAALAASGARVVIAELPDDAALSDVHALLSRAGFIEEARAPELVRDGVAIVFRRRELGTR